MDVKQKEDIKYGKQISSPKSYLTKPNQTPSGVIHLKIQDIVGDQQLFFV